jgi:ubiquinone/menaquinone biosynthesis C-methylase UbiE
MRLYRHHILPWFMELGLSRPEVQAQRREALRGARGRVLEIGFGFGATLSEYPAGDDGVQEVVALEPNPGMVRRAAPRIAAAALPVRVVRGTAEALPLRDACIDTVVSNWTLCSLPRLQTALAEVRRVLAPEGRFLFLEHGRSDEPRLARRQAFFAPLFRILGDGCRLDLPIDRAITAAGLRIERLDRYQAPYGPRIAGPMYRGVARP